MYVHIQKEIILYSTERQQIQLSQEKNDANIWNSEFCFSTLERRRSCCRRL